MPCSDGSWATELLLTEARVSNAALCGIFRICEQQLGRPLNIWDFVDFIDYQQAGISSQELFDWWNNHRARDQSKKGA